MSCYVLDEYKHDIIEHLYSFFEENTNRSLEECYYDVTTYSFESVKEGELRMFGFSKDSKNNEVQVVMGLLIDSNGISDVFLELMEICNINPSRTNMTNSQFQKWLGLSIASLSKNNIEK